MWKRWKEHKEKYEEGIQEDIALKEQRQEVKKWRAQHHEHMKSLQKLREEEHAKVVEKSSCTLEAQSMSDNSSTLLLPLVDTTSISAEVYVPLLETKQDTVAKIKTLEEERDRANTQVLIYRNLAERLRKENGNLKHEMNHKYEVIRDFWRNNLIEGCSRSGAIVKAALSSYACRKSSNQLGTDS